jgi:hypothetical protein
MFSEVAVHGWLAHYFWACGKAEHHSREHMVEKAGYLMARTEAREEEERHGVPIFHSRAHLQ